MHGGSLDRERLYALDDNVYAIVDKREFDSFYAEVERRMPGRGVSMEYQGAGMYQVDRMVPGSSQFAVAMYFRTSGSGYSSLRLLQRKTQPKGGAMSLIDAIKLSWYTRREDLRCGSERSFDPYIPKTWTSYNDYSNAYELDERVDELW
jgi:hypothetical protein